MKVETSAEAHTVEGFAEAAGGNVVNLDETKLNSLAELDINTASQDCGGLPAITREASRATWRDKGSRTS